MDIQELSKMKFFFWADTLKREFSVLQKRLDSGNTDLFKSDSERMLTLIGRYSNELKEELRKLTDYLSSVLEDKNISKQEHVDFDSEELKYTSILKGNGHAFIVKGYVALNSKAYISVIFDNTERKFTDINSLVSSLKSFVNKISNREAGTKTAANFDSALKEFLDYCYDVREKSFNAMNPKSPNLKWFHKLMAMPGSKYVKIVSMSNLLESDKQPKDSDFSSKSAWAFIDKSNGDVLKPNNWASPHSTPRANIFKNETWKNITEYGPKYLR